MNVLILKNSKLLYEFFGFNDNHYTIYGSYAIWEYLRNYKQKTCHNNRDYMIYFTIFKVDCKSIEHMFNALYFMQWYFSDINIISTEFGVRTIIWINKVINITLTVNLRLIVESSDSLYISNGKVISDESARSIARFETYLSAKLVDNPEFIPAIINMTFERVRFWDRIIGFPFSIVNIMSDIIIIEDCICAICSICSEEIKITESTIIALIAGCCGRKFHYQCLRKYCINSLDCYKCQEHGEYDFLIKVK